MKVWRQLALALIVIALLRNLQSSWRVTHSYLDSNKVELIDFILQNAVVALPDGKKIQHLRVPYVVKVPDEEVELTRNDSASKIQNKTLVIILGSIQGGKNAWKSLLRNVLDVNQADLALLIGEISDAETDLPEHHDILFERSRFIWYFEELDDWTTSLDMVNGTDWRNKLPSALIRPVGLVLLHQWFLAQLVSEHRFLLQTYERFVITSSDHYYLCPHVLSSLDDRHIWVPKEAEEKAVSSDHLVVASSDLLSALDVLPSVMGTPEQYMDILLGQTKNAVGQVIHQRWSNVGLIQKVQSFDNPMFTCSVEGDRGLTWKPISESQVREQVLLKDIQEYLQTYQTCRQFDNTTFLQEVVTWKSKRSKKRELWPFREDLRKTYSVLNDAFERNGLRVPCRMRYRPCCILRMLGFSC